jgi:hypothetical protein
MVTPESRHVRPLIKSLAIVVLQGPSTRSFGCRGYGDREDTYPLGGYGTADAAINHIFGSWGSP